VGGWEDYVRQSAGPQLRGSAGLVRESVGAGAAAPDADTRPREKRKLSYNEQREFEALPARIETLEVEQRDLTAEMEAPGFYKSGGERIGVVMARLARVGEELETLLARWLELDERA
jgi:ATP-binding cassette subfamily F protein uup